MHSYNYSHYIQYNHYKIYVIRSSALKPKTKRTIGNRFVYIVSYKQLSHVTQNDILKDTTIAV